MADDLHTEILFVSPLLFGQQVACQAFSIAGKPPADGQSPPHCGSWLAFIDLSKNAAKITPNARCVTARYDHGISNRKAESSGVLNVTAHAVLTPERETVRQNGRRIKNAEESMFTLTSQDRHGVLLIKEATKKGYKEALAGDSVDLAYADSNTRRGRVGDAIVDTFLTNTNRRS